MRQRPGPVQRLLSSETSGRQVEQVKRTERDLGRWRGFYPSREAMALIEEGLEDLDALAHFEEISMVLLDHICSHDLVQIRRRILLMMAYE